MKNAMSVNLDHQERNTLLRGLKHVRSTIALAVCDPTPESQQQREEDLHEIDHLMNRLNDPQVQSVAKV